MSVMTILSPSVNKPPLIIAFIIGFIIGMYNESIQITDYSEIYKLWLLVHLKTFIIIYSNLIIRLQPNI
jgi:type III secretory pathway component EscS